MKFKFRIYAFEAPHNFFIDTRYQLQMKPKGWRGLFRLWKDIGDSSTDLQKIRDIARCAVGVTDLEVVNEPIY